MKTGRILFFVAIASLYPLQAQQLSDFRWQHRVLLLMDSKNDPMCEQQLRAMKPHTKAMQERDLLLFIFDGEALLDMNRNRTQLSLTGIPTPQFQGVILIGMDGEVKLRKPFPLAPELIFKRIDAMPMRRAAIREGGRD